MKKVFSFIILVALILSIILFMESCKKEEYVTVEGVYFTDEFPSCPWQNEKDYDAIKIKFVGDMVYICFVYDKSIFDELFLSSRVMTYTEANSSYFTISEKNVFFTEAR